MYSPFKLLKEQVSESLNLARENDRLSFANHDKFIIWIVSFSIGGLALIATNLLQFSKLLDHHVIKIILILLASSVIGGILFRWSLYWQQHFAHLIEFYLSGAFSTKEMMEIDPDDLTNESDIKEVIRRLKVDFNQDVSSQFVNFDSHPPNLQQFLLEDLKKHYEKVAASVKEEYDLAQDYIKDTLIKAYAYSEQQYNRIFNQNVGKRFQRFRLLTQCAFTICCGTFVAVLLIIVCNY